MTSNEFDYFSKALRTYYPREKILPNEEAMTLWFRQLKDIDYSTALLALDKWVATNKWSPAISDLREMASEIEQGELPDWGEAWEKVIKAIARCGSYDEEGALSSMDEVTRISVQRLGWLNLCMSENIEIERANFRMIYEAEAKRKKREAQIPPRVAQLTAGMQLKRIDDMIRGEGENNANVN